MHLDPHIVVLAATSCGVGYLMTYAGLGKSLLERRRPNRICPSCGRHLKARVCPACTSS
jgi:NADH pyrophosphatase NudC (nudix superfamily)